MYTTLFNLSARPLLSTCPKTVPGEVLTNPKRAVGRRFLIPFYVHQSAPSLRPSPSFIDHPCVRRHFRVFLSVSVHFCAFPCVHWHFHSPFIPSSPAIHIPCSLTASSFACDAITSRQIDRQANRQTNRHSPHRRLRATPSLREPPLFGRLQLQCRILACIARV